MVDAVLIFFVVLDMRCAVMCRNSEVQQTVGSYKLLLKLKLFALI